MTSVVAEYPALYEAGNEGSEYCQRKFFALTKAQLWVLLSAAIVSGWNPVSGTATRAVAVATALLMVVALGVTFAARTNVYDDRWFACRALAENIKSATWRYVMQPAPRDKGAAALADERFAETMRELRERVPENQTRLAEHGTHGGLVTRWMTDTLRLSWGEKLRLYESSRVKDQIAWYSSKARTNARDERRWWNGLLTLEVASIAAATLFAVAPREWSPTGAVAAAAAGSLAWIQTKRFSDLSNAYRVAADDLTRIAINIPHVQDEHSFARLVDDVENTISREHRIWLERRSRP